MSGICGFASFTKEIIKQKDVLTKMTETLHRRGRDGFSYFESKNVLLGSANLNLEGQKEALFTQKVEGNTYTVVYNGRLYNPEEIRDLLNKREYNYSVGTETEIIIALYIIFKEECVKYLDGMFAFAIYDEKAKQVFLARDRVGAKPLFYSVKQNTLIFGSEIKALFCHEMVRPILDEEGICQIFGLGPARRMGSGVFHDVKEVKPASTLTFKTNHFVESKYWEVEGKVHTDNLPETIDKVRKLVTQSIKKHMKSNEPIGTLLSGGLDSSIISSVVSDEKESVLSTFSVDYEDNEKYFKPTDYQPNSDSYFIQLMQNHIRSNHRSVILTQEELLGSLEEVVLLTDLPGMADIDSSLYLFAREMKKEIRVALSGEGADEIFGGYPWFRKEETLNLPFFPWTMSLEVRKNILSEPYKRLDLDEYVRFCYNEIASATPYSGEETEEEKKIKRMFYINRYYFMQTLLTRKDRMTMGNALEVRMPFGDTKLIEYLWNVPWEMKHLKGKEKGLLREASKGILPEEVRLRKKSPYPKTHNPLYTSLVCEKMDRILEKPSSPIHQLVDQNAVKQMMRNNFTAVTSPWFGQLMTGPQIIAYLIQMNHWLEEYNVIIDGR